jgi:hypothetical protein
LLDEALLSLREKDRTALLLRFYERRSLRDVGASLGAGEDAAQKRVSSALEKLSQFFQRRGFKTASVAATTAALQQAATAAPASVAAALAQAALQTTPALTGLAAWASRVVGLTKLQTAAACLALAVLPVLWEWNQTHSAQQELAEIQSSLDRIGDQRNEMSIDVVRLRAESARLDSALTNTVAALARVENDTQKLAQWKARLQGLLTDPDYRWPDDLPYVRVPKSVVKDDLMHLREKRSGGSGQDFVRLFGESGTMTDVGLELLGIRAEERPQVEQALGNYWNGVLDLMAARAYETNQPATVSGGRLKPSSFLRSAPICAALPRPHETRSRSNWERNEGKCSSAVGTKERSRFSGRAICGNSPTSRNNSPYGTIPLPRPGDRPMASTGT